MNLQDAGERQRSKSCDENIEKIAIVGITARLTKVIMFYKGLSIILLVCMGIFLNTIDVTTSITLLLQLYCSIDGQNIYQEISSCKDDPSRVRKTLEQVKQVLSKTTGRGFLTQMDELMGD